MVDSQTIRLDVQFKKMWDHLDFRPENVRKNSAISAANSGMLKRKQWDLPTLVDLCITMEHHHV